MIGLVLVSEGRLAVELKAAMEHVVGPQRNVACVCLGPGESVREQQTALRADIGQVNDGGGVIVLTSILGEVDSLVRFVAKGENVKMIAGVNLPMLVKLAKMRGSFPLAECVKCAEAAGRKYLTPTGRS